MSSIHLSEDEAMGRGSIPRQQRHARYPLRSSKAPLPAVSQQEVFEAIGNAATTSAAAHNISKGIEGVQAQRAQDSNDVGAMFAALQRQIMELNNQQEKRWSDMEQVRKSDKKAMEVRMREMMEQADKTQTQRSRHSVETWRQGVQEITGQATALSLPTSRASRQLEDESMGRRDTRGPKLATPTPFTGKALELPNFLFTVREYLDIKSIEYSNERLRLGFITTVLSGSALDWWREAKTTITSAEEALQRMDTTFGDPLLPTKNFLKISKLKQTGTVGEFFLEAERLNTHTKLDQATLKQHLALGLKPEVSALLAGHTGEYTYKKWKETATRIGLQLDHNKLQNKQPDQSQRPSGSGSNQFRAQDNSRPQRTPVPTGARIFKANPGPPPRVPEAVIEQRKKDGLCYKCGKKGHIGRECKVGWILILDESHNPRNSRKRKGKHADRDQESKRQDSGKGPAA